MKDLKDIDHLLDMITELVRARLSASWPVEREGILARFEQSGQEGESRTKQPAGFYCA